MVRPRLEFDHALLHVRQARIYGRRRPPRGRPVMARRAMRGLRPAPAGLCARMASDALAAGGEPPEAGRPQGAISKSTRAILEAVAAGGEMPLEYMLPPLAPAASRRLGRRRLSSAAG